MDELLDALRNENPKEINDKALALFMTKDRRINKLEINAFEKFAPCKVYIWSSDAFRNKPYIGSIVYYGKEYGFG